MMETTNKVIEVLQTHGPLRAGDIAIKSGMEKKEIEKAIKTLKKEEKIFSPKRCFYDITNR